MLDSNKWKVETDLAIHWLNYTIFNQSTTLTYIRQLEFAILELRTMVKEVLISLDSTMAGKLSMNLIAPVMLRNILSNILFPRWLHFMCWFTTKQYKLVL